MEQMQMKEIPNGTWIPFYMEMADKLLDFKDNRKPLLDILFSLDKKFVDYIKKIGNGNQLSDIDPFTVFGVFNRGISDDNRLKLCQFFKDKLDVEANIPSDFDGIPVVNNMKATFYSGGHADTDIQHLWNLFEAVMANNESEVRVTFDNVCKQKGIKWNITMGLYWMRPYEYISLDSRNREYLPTLGIDVFNDNQIDAKHYLSLLSAVKKKILDGTISEKSIPEISYRAWILDNASTDVNMNKNYWLVGFNYGDDGSQIDRFFKERIWESRYNDGSASDQKLLALAKTIKKGDVIILKSTATKGSGHDVPFLRVKGVGIVETGLEIAKKETFTQCECRVHYINREEKDFDGSAYGAYRKTIHKADSKVKDIVDYVESLLQKIEAVYKEYIGLLKAAHNLVLTGAPGTGKTYMAKRIAEKMGCKKEEMCFVQFHPSYDYTDFVEGLRPVENCEGQIGFERKDGVFKDFCKRAVKNLADSQKSVENLTKENSWEEKLQQFIDDAIENNSIFILSNGSKFAIQEIKGRSIVVRNEQNEKTPEVNVSVDDVIELLTKDVSLDIVRDIRNYFKRKYGKQADSYAFVITKEIRKMKTVVSVAPVDKIERKDFVFIIDEINRGEASKIFGELFYAIDPGYRGKTKMNVPVTTQYQNLVPESDVFAGGFYVPENVYILATMNDIDRSVESMDFAMRRRFTWKEVKPEDTESMLDILDCAVKAKTVMHNLNREIKNTEGLGDAYQVGPAYFLKLKDNGGDFEKLWEMNIEPLLREYLRGFRNSEEIMSRFGSAYGIKTTD